VGKLHTDCAAVACFARTVLPESETAEDIQEPDAGFCMSESVGTRRACMRRSRTRRHPKERVESLCVCIP
jgi:hypothetical protein